MLLVWRRNASDDFNQAYSSASLPMLSLLDSAQSDIADYMYDTTPDVMQDMGSRGMATRSTDFDTSQLVGYAGNGVDTFSDLWESVIAGKSAVKNGADTPTALRIIENGFEQRARTVLADTARSAGLASAKSIDINAHYVRALTPPSCGRCVILAGMRSGKVAFERHPRCDCTAVWSTDEGALATHYTDAGDYLNSLSDDELSNVLRGSANARAYRDGADLNQLVNAYRKRGDVRSAQLYGRDIKYTIEGTTKHGVAYQRMKQAGYVKQHVLYGSKYWRADRPRLMPETIYQIAKGNQSEAERLLRNYGWILD